MKSLADRLREEKGGGKATLQTISSIANYRVARLQIEGPADSGKSWFMLSIMKHYKKVLGYPLKNMLFGLMDYDVEGIAPLLVSGVIPPKWHERILYHRCKHALDGYEAYDLFLPEFEKHEAKYGFVPWWFLESTTEFWSLCQQNYGEMMKGKPYHEILLDRQREAESKKKKTLPVFDQLLDYRNINPMHNELASKLCDKQYNLCWTSLLTTRKFEEDGEEVERTVGGGQKYNEAKVDFIFRRYRKRKSNMAYIDGHKQRGVSGRLMKVQPADFTTVMNDWYKMLTREMRKKKMDVPEIPWLTPYREKEIAKADRIGKEEEEAEASLEAEDEHKDDDEEEMIL